MAKGKSKGRNNSGGGGVATIIGTTNPYTIDFINKQINDLGLTGNIIVEFRERTASEPTELGFVNFSKEIVRDGEYRFHKPEMKATILTNDVSIDIIAHELKHLQQMQEGKYKRGYRIKPETYIDASGIKRETVKIAEEGFFWKGKFYMSTNEVLSVINGTKKAKTQEEYAKAYKKYRALPWEKEAHAVSDKYYK